MTLIPKNQCLRCGGEMKSAGVEKIQLGQTGFFTGDWPNILAGALEVEIFMCKACGKLEFYKNAFKSASDEEPAYEEFDPFANNNLPQRTCPECGRSHDIDYPKCPFCKHNYAAEQE